MNIIKRIEKLEKAVGVRRAVGRWLKEEQKPEKVRVEMLVSGEITKNDFVQFVRWRTREEEDADIANAS